MKNLTIDNLRLKIEKVHVLLLFVWKQLNGSLRNDIFKQHRTENGNSFSFKQQLEGVK